MPKFDTFLAQKAQKMKILKIPTGFKGFLLPVTSHPPIITKILGISENFQQITTLNTKMGGEFFIFDIFHCGFRFSHVNTIKN